MYVYIYIYIVHDWLKTVANVKCIETCAMYEKEC